jgi:hypothetical protein
MRTTTVERNQETVRRLCQLEAAKAFFAPLGPAAAEVYRLVAEGDVVAVHSHYQHVPQTTASGNDMFSRLS